MASRVIALTGTDTFLGRNLLALFEQGDRWSRILAIDERPPQTAGPKTVHHALDLTQASSGAALTDLFRTERVEVVAHLAHLASPTHATAWGHEYEVIGTLHVVSACEAAAVRKLVSWSSTHVYGARPDNPNFLSEDHPLRASERNSFLRDRIEAEQIALKLAERVKKVTVTILRVASILGPTVRSFVTEYLSRAAVPTMLGYDPLVQFIHEADAVAAFELAIERDVPGVFNVVGDGVLPLSTVIKLVGRAGIPIPYSIARRLVEVMWVGQLIEAPPSYLDYLRYLCVADGARAAQKLDFQPAFTSRDAVVQFAETLKHPDAAEHAAVTPA